MKTLLLIDIQYDFLPGGELAVFRGDEVVPVANRLIPLFPLVVASQDWHPPNHGSFAIHHPGKKTGDVIELQGLPQVLWPPHCIQGSRGAELAEDLHRDGIHEVFRKGMDPDIDSYSAFFDNGHRKSTGLAEYLWRRQAGPLYIMGLATEYCVKYSALDALGQGFETHVVEDGCRAVDLAAGDGGRALREMEKAGARRIKSADLARKMELAPKH
jgi:nicotinamidase/pyrazinamidase